MMVMELCFITTYHYKEQALRSKVASPNCLLTGPWLELRARCFLHRPLAVLDHLSDLLVQGRGAGSSHVLFCVDER